MRLQLLGSGGFHPNERRHTACWMIPECRVVFDAGTSAFRIAERLESTELQIFLTHAHLDHIAGLTYLLVPMLDGRLERVQVIANESTLAAVQEHLFSDPVFPVEPGFEFVRLESRKSYPLCDGGVVTWCPLPSHPGGSTGFRIDWPASGEIPAKSVAYITDTFVDGTYDSFVTGVDLLIHECYFDDELGAKWAERTGHSFSTQVADLASRVGAGQLVLVHVNPGRSEADPIGLEAMKARFRATEIGEDLMVLQV
ncbi:Ribonuclease BN [Maioricimonas rarisocia]|uniref:Ribonuclease BN n=1 Tax=Maioricimonas rarisocia TaxID=2528026 RepID=A0A517ZBN4_9PLAN|nr:MBL fold metallo-hydrolase [Maioricimonas rarisocia]QDU39905.1 Ribonuclease BN [Maioricimonas rarisocia]